MNCRLFATLAMRLIPRLRQMPVAAAFLLLVGAACNDAPTGPQFGNIKVSVQTSGGVPDDAFSLVVGTAVRRTIGTSETAVISVSAGTQSVALEVAANCTVTNASSRSVDVPAGKTIDVAFVIVCATTGIEIHTHTTGPDNPPFFEVLLNNQSVRTIDPNTSLVVGGVKAGSYTVTLRSRGDNCTITGDHDVTVNVTSRTVTPVAFDMVCVPPVRLDKIAYAFEAPGSKPGTTSIGLVNSDGSGKVDLGFGSSPAWSPDGTRLVFSTAQCTYYDGCIGDLVVLDPETGSVRTLVNGRGAFSPSWAPAGDVIAFISRDYYGTSSELFVIGLDGSPAVKVPIAGVTELYEPVWSPDGQKIAFECVVAPYNYDVCVINKDGSGLVRLTTDADFQGNPAWSPDGSRIAFTLATSQAQVAVMASDGSAIKVLTPGYDPSWSPDGKRLVFSGNDGLFTIDVDGSNLKRLTNANDYAPSWRP